MLIVRLVQLAFNLLIVAIIVRAMLSWFTVDRRHPALVFLARLTDPLLEPVRRAMGTHGPVDFSPAVVILILIVIESVLVRALAALM